MNTINTKTIDVPIINAEYFFYIGDSVFDSFGSDTDRESPVIYFHKGLCEWVFDHGKNKVKNEKAKEFCRYLNHKIYH